ncbi:hypothetical protein B0H34DRAFT_694056 [Crassisporium funariophilum]|nr:hypothetical protein B0H34DRAFT_694056 [Crassisporium funariophilum]
MPRRSPPSSLRLAPPGPTPMRSTPKHIMPSVPRPAMRRPCESSVTAQAQARARSRPEENVVVAEKAAVRTLRGPWDHSGSIATCVNVDRLLQPLQRAMIVLRG